MSDIYLSRIRIENFRTFGYFDVSLPIGPGLTLVTGTNGLGKSSFFDAIEWGLTGKIRRFDRYNKSIDEGRYLTRRGAPTNSHNVALSFSDGTNVERSVTVNTSPTTVAECLRRDDWGPIRDVGTYLAFTHFLGQAAQQRFTSREGPEQWEALKGPSGIERLEDVRQGLRGRATQLAFTKRIDQEKNVVDDLERQLAQWQSWRSRLDRLQQAASASGLRSPEGLADAITDLEREIASISAARLVMPEVADNSHRLTLLGEHLEGAQRAAADRRGSLDAIATLPARYVTLVADSRLDGPALMRARAAVEAARVVFVQSETAAKVASVKADDQAKLVASLQVSVDLLEAARRDLERHDQLEPLIAAARKEASDLGDRIAAHRVELTAIEQSIARVSEARDAAARAQAAVDVARQAVETCRDLAYLEAAESASAMADAVAAENGSRALSERSELVKARDGVAQQLADAEAALRAARRRAGEIAAAVARIAPHIHDEDTSCPVCSTSFEPGVLKLIVEAANTSGDAELASSQAAVERLRSDQASLDRHIATLEDVIARASQAQLKAQADAATVADARRAIAAALSAESKADLHALAAARYQVSQNAWATAEERLRDVLSSTSGASNRQVTARAELDDMVGRQDLAAARMAALEGERRSCAERLIAKGLDKVTHDALTERVREEQAQILSAQQAQRALATTAEQAVTNLTEHRSSLVAAERELDQATGAREAAARSASAIADQWVAAGLEPQPSETGFEAARVSALDAIRSLDRAAARLSGLARDNEITVLQREIDEVRAAMSAAAGDEAALADQARHEALLEERLKSARAAHKLSTSARAAVNKFTASLKQEAVDFSTQFLAPLNSVIDDFNEAMLSTPGETIRFNAEHRVDTTRFEMMLHSRDRVDDANFDRELPPQIVLSEGQLAANGFSILCAASTAYPWSRWRALLLDDPLQHNDIIHTAAFVDVMRNMVELKGYQLIMSSHDRAESEFIARKFDAAGLPCSTVTLTAPSAAGVQYDGPVDNRVAAHSRWKAMRPHEAG